MTIEELSKALKILNEAAKKNDSDIGCFHNIEKFIPNGGPIIVPLSVYLKGRDKHKRNDMLKFIVQTLENMSFATKYKEGVLNFYARVLIDLAINVWCVIISTQLKKMDIFRLRV